MEKRIEELQQSVETYRRLVDRYASICQNLRERRKGTIDGVMVEIDQTLKAKEDLIVSLKHAIASTEAQIEAEKNSLR